MARRIIPLPPAESWDLQALGTACDAIRGRTSRSLADPEQHASPGVKLLFGSDSDLRSISRQLINQRVFGDIWCFCFREAGTRDTTRSHRIVHRCKPDRSSTRFADASSELQHYELKWPREAYLGTPPLSVMLISCISLLRSRAITHEPGTGLLSFRRSRESHTSAICDRLQKGHQFISKR